MKEADTIVILVDNEIAVQNLSKMANQKGYGFTSQKLEEQKFEVSITIHMNQIENTDQRKEKDYTNESIENKANANEATIKEDIVSTKGNEGIQKVKNTIVVISSALMGNGNDELGAVLMKGFLYALLGQENLPSAILFFNGGATLTCKGSASLEDLKTMEDQGVDILTCGTCLNFYGLTDKLSVGNITNMYVITEMMMGADHIVKPC